MLSAATRMETKLINLHNMTEQKVVYINTLKLAENLKEMQNDGWLVQAMAAMPNRFTCVVLHREKQEPNTADTKPNPPQAGINPQPSQNKGYVASPH